MVSPDGKWVDARMLDIIRRAVQIQAISDIERQDLAHFLDMHSPTPVAETHPPPYTEARGHGSDQFLPLHPLQDARSDSGSSIRRTSTHGTNQTASSGSGNRGQLSTIGSPQASPSASARQARSSTTPTRSPRASSSASTGQDRFQAITGVGPGQPGAEGDIHDLLVPDPRRDNGASGSALENQLNDSRRRGWNR